MVWYLQLIERLVVCSCMFFFIFKIAYACLYNNYIRMDPWMFMVYCLSFKIFKLLFCYVLKAINTYSNYKDNKIYVFFWTTAWSSFNAFSLKVIFLFLFFFFFVCVVAIIFLTIVFFRASAGEERSEFEET